MERNYVMDRRDELRLDDFIRESQAPNEADHFSHEAYRKLCELLPHKMFAYAKLDVERAQIVSIVNNSFPSAYVDQPRMPEGRLTVALVSKWLQVMRPLYFNRNSRPLEGYLLNGQSGANEFQRIEIHNIAVHGKVDAQRSLASCFIFGDLEDPDGRRTKIILHSVTPHLHALLMPCSSGKSDSFTPSLSVRERHVLSLLADGHTDAAIGSRLHISVCTVRIHVRNILRKLNAANRTHAVVKALRSKLLQLSLILLINGPTFVSFEGSAASIVSVI